MDSDFMDTASLRLHEGSGTLQRGLVTTTEAAALLRVSVATVQSWCESGLLVSWRTGGGHRRIERASVERLLGQPQPGADGRRAPAAQRPTVVVVEDDANLLRLYEARISRWAGQPQVLCLNNMVLALLRIGRQAPKMLILDLHVPGMDGFGMLHHLRHSGSVDNTVIAVVTGLDAGAIDDRGGLPGDIDVFAKPIPFDRLEALWKSALAEPVDLA
jgi:excisionase family DNA binding protein